MSYLTLTCEDPPVAATTGKAFLVWKLPPPPPPLSLPPPLLPSPPFGSLPLLAAFL